MSERKSSREDELLETAIRLFKEKGFHNTSMQDLADALGMQKGSLYYYIDSKEELLWQLLERAMRVMTVQIDEIYAAEMSPQMKLRLALQKHAVTMMENLDLISVYLQEYRSLPPERLKEALNIRKHYEKVLMQIIRDGIQAGEFRAVDEKMALFGILGMLNWTHQWFSPQGKLTAQEIADLLIDLVMNGLNKRNDTTPSKLNHGRAVWDSTSTP